MEITYKNEVVTTLNMAVRAMGEGESVKCMWSVMDAPESGIVVGTGTLQPAVQSTCTLPQSTVFFFPSNR